MKCIRSQDVALSVDSNLKLMHTDCHQTMNGDASHFVSVREVEQGEMQVSGIVTCRTMAAFIACCQVHSRTTQRYRLPHPASSLLWINATVLAFLFSDGVPLFACSFVCPPAGRPQRRCDVTDTEVCFHSHPTGEEEGKREEEENGLFKWQQHSRIRAPHRIASCQDLNVD